MTKVAQDETMIFGQRLAELRKARGFTQQEFADEVGISRRMVAYYEGQSQHPPTTHLPVMARVLKLSTDELLGTAAIKQRAKPTDTRMQRRLQQIEKLDVPERRQILQLIDTFIEHGQLRRKTNNKQAAK